MIDYYNDKITDHYDGTNRPEVLNDRTAGTSDLILSEDGLEEFIRLIKKDIRDNYHFVSVNDMAEKEQNNKEFNSDEKEINIQFSEWRTNDEYIGKICIINMLIPKSQPERYTWVRSGKFLKLMPPVPVNEKDREAGTIYVDENNGASGYVVQVKGFDEYGNYTSYNEELQVEELGVGEPIDTSGNTRYFIRNIKLDENENIDNVTFKYENILPTQIMAFRENDIQVYKETEESRNQSKTLKTNIIICDNLNADNISFNNFNLNENTRINVSNGDEAYRYVNNVVVSNEGSQYIYEKVPVGMNGDYTYSNKVFATLIEVPKNTVVRIKNPTIQDWTLDKGTNNPQGRVQYNGTQYYVYKQILIKYKRNEEYLELNPNDLLPFSTTTLPTILYVETKYEFRSGTAATTVRYNSAQLSTGDTPDYATTYTNITKISDYSSNLEYANDIQQYKFLGKPADNITVKYIYPLITGENKQECIKDDLYFTTSEFYIGDIKQIPKDSPDVLIYNQKVIGIKKVDNESNIVKIITQTLPLGNDAYSLYNDYNNDESDQSITKSFTIDDLSTSQRNRLLSGGSTLTAYKHFLKIRTINNSIIELTEDDIEKTYDLDSIQSFIIEKKVYTVSAVYANYTINLKYTYKNSTTVEILKSNMGDEDELEALFTAITGVDKYQYLESWTKIDEQEEHDSNKVYYRKVKENENQIIGDSVYVTYEYDIDTWRDALSKGLYVLEENNSLSLVTPNSSLNYVAPKGNQVYKYMNFRNYNYIGEAEWSNSLVADGNGKINIYKFNPQNRVMTQISTNDNHPSYLANYYYLINDNNQFEEVENASSIQNINQQYPYYKKIGISNNYYYSVIQNTSDIHEGDTIYQFKAEHIYNNGINGFDAIKENGNYYYLNKNNYTWQKVVSNTTYDENITYIQINFTLIDSIEELKNNRSALVSLINGKNLFYQSSNSYILVPDHATYNSNEIYAQLVGETNNYNPDEDNDNHSNWKASVRQGNIWLKLNDNQYQQIRDEYQYDSTKTYYEKVVNDYIKDMSLITLKNYYIYYHYNDLDNWNRDRGNGDIYLKNEFWYKDNLTNIYEQAVYGEDIYYNTNGNFYIRELITVTEINNSGETVEPGAGYGEFDARVEGSITTLGGIAARKSIKGYKVHGAVFNDYAEYRHTENIKSGKCVVETGNGDLILSNKRLQLGANIISDTYGFSIGETAYANTPIAVCGRVLAYPWEFRETFTPGQAVCSGPNGTVSKMSREEIKDWPDAIVGYVSEIPQYKYWGSDNINVDGRIWIKVK